jgi:5-carboxymethyl-2-hydroxymuconate isomerase
MPHLTLDYTHNLAGHFDSQVLFAELHDALASLGVDRNSLMSRAIELRDWRVGDGDARRAFVHLKIAFLDKRTPEFKKQALATVNPILAKAFARPLCELILQVNIEILDIRAEFYEKIVSQ